MHSICKIFSITFAIFCLQLLALKCEGIGYPPPHNCELLECPAYDLVHSEKDFEIRTYKTANWMSFPVNTSQFESAKIDAFNQLYAYISGNNKGKIRIGMTAPVLLDVGFATKSSLYTMYLYLPKEFQANPPTPLSSKDQLVKFPSSKFAAIRRFEGDLSEKAIEEEAKNLKNSLKGTPWESAISIAAYDVAGYSAPFEAHPVNEILIWFK